MPPDFLLYGATGFVGSAAARLAHQRGHRPLLAGRSEARLAPLAGALGLPYRVVSLDDPAALDRALDGVRVVLNCAGPFTHTARPVVAACLRQAAHYLDLSGEIPTYEAIAAHDAEARARGVMLLPGVGFDVVPTDCLAVHLHRRLPTATRLTLAFHSEGPAGLPPGTQRTAIELLPYGNRVRRGGRLEVPRRGLKTRRVDFGKGPVRVARLTWGDVFTAYHSTGIPDIEDYVALPGPALLLLAAAEFLRPLLARPAARALLQRVVQAGPTAEQRARTRTHVWGEVADDAGRRAVSRLHGPEAGVVWTIQAALAAVEQVVAGNAPPGYQTPGKAYGPDFVLRCEGVTREDIPSP